MTPELLAKVKVLVEAGATVVGSPPRKSPSLAGYPQCDEEVQRLASELWGPAETDANQEHRCGMGRVIPSPMGDAQAYDELHRQAKWIWGGDGDPAIAAPVGNRYFRRILDIQAGRKILSATVAMTADNPPSSCRSTGSRPRRATISTAFTSSTSHRCSSRAVTCWQSPRTTVTAR